MKTIVEVGAYRGAETEHFLEDKDARVFAFEPDHDLFQELQIKATEEPRLYALPMAVGIGNAQITLFLLPDGNSMTELPLFSNYNPYGMDMGWSIRLDTFMYLYNIDTIDYLRIDAPFQEEMCLESMGAHFKDVQAGRIRCYEEPLPIANWLQSHGVMVWWEPPQGSETLHNVAFRRKA